MGAEPGEAYLSVVLPDSLGEDDVVALHRGAEALAAECGVTIAGGDLARGPALTIAVTVIGWADSDGRTRRPRRRAARRPRRRDRRPRRGGGGPGRLRRAARRARPTATCARGRGSPRAARSPRAACTRCSTCPTAWRSTRGGSPRRAACGSSSTRPRCRRRRAEVASALGMSAAELAATGGEDYELLVLRAGARRGRRPRRPAPSAGSAGRHGRRRPA